MKKLGLWHWTLLFLIIALTASLPLLSEFSKGLRVWDSQSAVINQQIVYQGITVLVTILFLGSLCFIRPQIFLAYFKKGRVDAPIRPVPQMGINPKPHENWKHTGRDIALIISIVTALIIYFQVVRGEELQLTNWLYALPFSVLFALTNSFVEEMICRLGLIVALKGRLADQHIAIVSAILFGTVHYWGNPGGIPGVLAAGFLAWFLTKSILETRGIFWAWLIHFLQDLIILSAILSTS